MTSRGSRRLMARSDRRRARGVLLNANPPNEMLNAVFWVDASQSQVESELPMVRFLESSVLWVDAEGS